MTEIQKKLFELQDIEYRNFQAKLIPVLSSDSVIGVRTPELKALAKIYAKELESSENLRFFLSDLPHKYFDENQLHAFILCEIKDFETCIKKVEEFLPFVDNWATCDQLSPKVFARNKSLLLPYVYKWLDSEQTYSIRFAIAILMRHFLEKSAQDKKSGFCPEYLKKVASLCRPHIKNADDNYYINMMISWYFATALAKEWEFTYDFLKNKNELNEWCFRKTIQKAKESYRVSPGQKELLQRLLSRKEE